jgi:uncharacterized protein
METVLKRIVDYINHIADPEEIILFGSMASGTNDACSDIDLLIISENTHQRHKIIQEIKAFIAQLGYRSDILMLKNEELKNEIENPKSLLHNALKIHQKIYKK